MAALFRLCLILVLLGAVQVLGARRGQSHRHMSRLHSYFKRQHGELFVFNQLKSKICIRLRVRLQGRVHTFVSSRPSSVARCLVAEYV